MAASTRMTTAPMPTFTSPLEREKSSVHFRRFRSTIVIFETERDLHLEVGSFCHRGR